jgi:pSer/pThr/pTyr-binding forkhead associated (FHA) protein
MLRPFGEVQSSPKFSPLRLVLQPSERVLELDRPDVVLGRHSQADVRLPLPDVSRRHCRFLWSDGSWQVFDLQSTNGVYVNDQRVTRTTLHPGDQVRIGGFTFVVAISAASGSTASFGDAAGDEPEMLRNIADALPAESPPAQRRAS